MLLLVHVCIFLIVVLACCTGQKKIYISSCLRRENVDRKPFTGRKK